MSYDFGDEMPKPGAAKKKAPNAEEIEPVGMDDKALGQAIMLDDIVLPPDESMMDIDAMLDAIPSEADQGPPSGPEISAPNLAMEDADSLDLDIQVERPSHYPSDAMPQAGDGQDAPVTLDDPDGVGGPLRAETLDGGFTLSADQAMPVVEKPESFLQKHKAKVVLAVVLGVMLGYNQYKKASEGAVAPAVVQDSAGIDPYREAAIEIQGGKEDVSHLEPEWPMQADAAPADDEGLVLDWAAGSDSETQAEGQPEEVVEVAERVEPVEVIQPAAGIDPAEQAQPVSTVDAPVEAKPEPGKVMEAAAEPVSASMDRLIVENARLEKALATMQARAETAERRLRQASAPRVSATKPQAARPVTTAAPIKARRPEIQFIGSFLQGGDRRAHVIVAGNLYELSRGQRISDLVVDSVNSDGVVIDGVLYN